jgi:hypothetical protein
MQSSYLNQLINRLTLSQPYEKRLSGICHQKCPENVWVLLSMSGKCLSFDLKIDQTCCPVFFTIWNLYDKCPEKKFLDVFQTNKTGQIPDIKISGCIPDK